MERALLIDPENFNMRYNFACALNVYLKDKEAALQMLAPVFGTITETFLPYVKVDPDLELLRDDPRFQALVTATEERSRKPETGDQRDLIEPPLQDGPHVSLILSRSLPISMKRSFFITAPTPASARRS
jgi:hypothetical protein